MEDFPLGAKIFIGNILRAGLVIAITFGLYGTFLFLGQNGHQIYDFHLFKGEPQALVQLSKMWDGVLNHESTAIMQIGILVLLVTPLLRVISCLLIFIWQRDYLYIFLASIVTGILLFSFAI